MYDQAPRTRPATREDFPELAVLLVRSFRADPFHGWLFPDDRVRPARQLRLFERLLLLYDRHGVVHTTEDRAGVAMWDPPRDEGPGLAEVLTFLLSILPVFGWRALAVAEGMAPLAGLPFLLLEWGGGLSFMSYVGHVIFGFVAALVFELKAGGGTSRA